MAKTVVQVLTGAFAKSSKNEVRDLAAQRTSLIEIVDLALKGLFAVAARVNPTFYGKIQSVAAVADKWERPADLELLFWMEFNAAELALVPYDDRTAEPGIPAVYALGRFYFPAGNAEDPTGGDSIDLWYSRGPETVADYTDEIDADFPERFLELLYHEVAIHLAIRDQRNAEAEELKEPRNKWLNLYVEHVEHVNAAERRRFAHLRRFNSNQHTPISALVAGGQ